MAALDYMVSIASDVFIPSYDGNMARVVEGHRRWASSKHHTIYFLLWNITQEMFEPVRSLIVRNHKSLSLLSNDYKTISFDDVLMNRFFRLRYKGFRKTILLDRVKLVELLDLFQGGTLSWDEFSAAVKAAHQNHMGQPTERRAIPGRPKEEDYFYANPQECHGSKGGLIEFL